MAYTTTQIGAKRPNGLVTYGNPHPDCICNTTARFPVVGFFVAVLDVNCPVHKDAPDKTGGS